MKSDLLVALVAKWRKEAAIKDSFHATMGIGWKVCADDLDAILRTQEGEGPPAAVNLESLFHERFAALRHRGEWFAETPELLGCIRAEAQPWKA